MQENITHNAAEVRIEHLSKRFGELYAVKDVNLHIQKGDFYTFLGPSGCGKTTLLRMIAGFTTPDEGEIYFDEQRINDIPPWERNVGMVFQSYALWPHLSVFDNIAFGLRERKVPKAAIQDKVYAALKMVNLASLEKRRPSQLSGGQQQRVALARTLVIEPRLLLLDEPLSNLDAKLRIQMRNELLRLQRELGLTTIYVTHDQEEALAISTRIAVMSQGIVVQQGTPKEIYETPWTQTVADFVGTSNFLAGKVVNIDGDYVQLESQDAESFLISWKYSFEEPPRLGIPLIVNIRPESLHLSALECDDSMVAKSNRIEGKIITSVYLGSLIQYEVEIASGNRIKVNTQNPRRTPLLQKGESVFLTFSPYDAVLLHPSQQK
ncbi:ABC transporter ATP-binding protein [Candidatus Poribacteria bacterium]|nr:ABC transporter ATP-binding protein [Candidatus Poribacteria bacterium]